MPLLWIFCLQALAILKVTYFDGFMYYLACESEYDSGFHTKGKNHKQYNRYNKYSILLETKIFEIFSLS